MSIAVLLLFLGLANWVSTLILVESELTRDFREAIDRRAEKAVADATGQLSTSKRHLWRVNTAEWFWCKLHYLVGCHLCAGTWVALAMAAFLPALTGPWLVGWVLNALVIKALGHLVLVLHKGVESWTDLNRRSDAFEEAPEPVVHSHVRPVHSFHATEEARDETARVVNEWFETQLKTKHKGRWSG